MIELNGVKISDEDFSKIAEQQGYEKKFEYPLVMQSRHNDSIWEFTELQKATCLASGDSPRQGGYMVCAGYITSHTDTTVWKPCERPEKLYDGLTAEQWQQVIDEKLFIQVRDRQSSVWYPTALNDFNKDALYKFNALGVNWKYCSIHKSQPQFGGRADWVKDDDLIVALYSCGTIETTKAFSIDWKDVARWQVVKL